MLKTIHLEAATSEEARRKISELPVRDVSQFDTYNEGDRAIVTFPDGTIQIYVLKTEWAKEEDEDYVLKP